MFLKRGMANRFFRRNVTLVAISTLIGTIVGAGVLGIPYVVSQAGFLYGFLLMLVLGVAFMIIHLFMGEIVLRTKKQYQLTGYAEKYLGKKGKVIMTLSMLLSTYGALTAYLIGEGATLQTVIGFGNPLIYTFIFFIISLIIIYKGMKTAGNTELILVGLLLLSVMLMGIFSMDEISLANLGGFTPANFFLPYGVILFAYMALPAIPEVQEVLGKNKNKMKKAIIAASIIPIFLYILFALVVVGIVGKANFSLLEPSQQIATIALSIYSLPILGLCANILAILAMFTSFLTLGIALIELYEYDYGLKRSLAFVLTFSIPLAIVLLKLTSFIAVLAVTGAFAGGLEGILVVLMYWKAKLAGDRKPEYQLGQFRVIGMLLILIFAFGIIYEIWSNFF
ncbi:MAG: aromatic amino acid transport family protein [Nanoarchaeota archaeon]|nr:aromatic amino acid transport family protein [Nanoarchaeota archaeon]